MNTKTQPVASEPKLPEFYAALEYNAPDRDVMVCVYQRRENDIPLRIHREALPPQQYIASSPVAHETLYETIIKWDEGGGKRSRRELARRIASLYSGEPVAVPHPYLADATRFKVVQDSRNQCKIYGLPTELAGRWVALVAAEDDCHLSAAPSPAPVGIKKENHDI